MSDKSEKELADEYFKEANGWETDKITSLKKSEKRAWTVASGSFFIVVLLGISIVSIMPLKTVEPYVIRVDQTTGGVDIIDVLKEQDITAQEAVNKMFLSKYIRHRDGYLWETREHDRKIVGLLSDSKEQEEYAMFTDPKKNPQAPVTIYGTDAEVKIKIKSISQLNDGVKANKETHFSSMVRYTKNESRLGESPKVTHWVATVVYTYRRSPMKSDDRYENPLGFQVISFRSDLETGGLD
jgi:type IV secretion system protein VirB8